MTFQIRSLDPDAFAALFDLSDTALTERRARRVVATESPGFPCRVSLAEAEKGETLLLLNYQHLDVSSPYAAKHAIYVRQDAEQAFPAPGTVPDILSSRLLSVRAFDETGEMVEADIVEGADLARQLTAFFMSAKVEFADIHAAKRGCFMARAERA